MCVLIDQERAVACVCTGLMQVGGGEKEHGKKRKEKLRRQQNTPCINKEKETHWPEVL